MEKYLTSEQVATFLQVHPFTVLKYLKDGRLPGVKIGRMYRIKESDVEAFLGEVSTSKKENAVPQGTLEPKISLNAPKQEKKQKEPDHQPEQLTHELKTETKKEEDYYAM